MSREYFPGMGQAVADRTVNRQVFSDDQRLKLPPILTLNPDDSEWCKTARMSDYPTALDERVGLREDKPKTRSETWGEVADRVSIGNVSLHPGSTDREPLRHHIAQGTILMSGRHLQHGDAEQHLRPMEVFTNCSTSLLRALTFKLLLSGSGVGGSYDDDLMVVDWTKMPIVVPVIDWGHKDVIEGRVIGYPTLREAQHLYADHKQIVFKVPDTREGWAKAIEWMEILAYRGETNTVLILDFSDVRPHGFPIRGMQNRPASGPGPLMGAITNATKIRGTHMAPWKAAMFIDHYLAECVLVGGARRAARIAIKYWRDPTIFDFINVKRPIEFIGKTPAEVEALRAEGSFGSFLWSSNNSVAVDWEFWEDVLSGRDCHARRVYDAVIEANYGDGTGEPGFLNVDKLSTNKTGLERYRHAIFAGSDLYQLEEVAASLVWDLTEAVLGHAYHFIVNPCGEIVLFLLGGFCVIGDLALYHAESQVAEEQATRQMTRALMRTNLMDSIYREEVKRTNRIGVSLTGIHEWAWSRFELSFRDLIAEDPSGLELIPGLAMPAPHAMPFWRRLSELALAVDDEARLYAAELGVNVPHTTRTIKPAGTTSKLFGLSEGAHLPAMREYLRWVQFRSDDPDVQKYEDKGYPTKKLNSYSGTTVVGFPTQPVICQIMPSELIVTASEATPAEQFRWIRLLEFFWIGGETGNQISYTLKYDPKVVSFDEFRQVMLDNVRQVRAVSVLPKEDAMSYEYTPEQALSRDEYADLVSHIEFMEEDIDMVHLDCAGGACPIDFDKSIG